MQERGGWYFVPQVVACSPAFLSYPCLHVVIWGVILPSLIQPADEEAALMERVI